MSKEKCYYLGIDQGTTGTTAMITDERFCPVATGYRTHKQFNLKSGLSEQDGEDLFVSAVESAREAMAKAGITAEEIRCVGIDNQGESVVAWDSRTGKPVSPVITWQDKRTSDVIDRLDEGTKEKIHAITGLIPDAYFSATKLRWILDNIPEAARLKDEGFLRMGTLDTFLIDRFTCGKAFVTDHTTASRTMLYSLDTGSWDDYLMNLFGVPRACLAEICDTACDFGCADARFWGAPVAITGSAVDQQSALFGQSCFRPGEVKTTYGTGCFMLLNTGDQPVRTDSGLLATVAWAIGGKRTFALDGGVYAAGSVINWMRDMGLYEKAPETEALAKSVENTDGLFFIPAFSGLSAPYWDQDAKGTVLGMTLGTKRAHLVRAALEGIAYQVADILLTMEKDLGSRICVMKADGGLSANGFLMQFQADINGVPIAVPAMRETTVLGVIRLAAIGGGYISGPEAFSDLAGTGVRYEAAIGETERRACMDAWHEAVAVSRIRLGK